MAQRAKFASFLQDMARALKKEDDSDSEEEERVPKQLDFSLARNPANEAWLCSLREVYEGIKTTEDIYANALRVMNSAPAPYKQQANVVSAEMRQQVKMLKQTKAKVKEMLDPTVAGHSKVLGTKGLTPKSFIESGIGIANLIGLANPVAPSGHSVEETPAGDSDLAFNAPTTIKEAVASRIELAGEVVQDTVSKGFSVMPESYGSRGYAGEIANFNYRVMAERPNLVKTLIWDSTQASGALIGEFKIPQIFREQPTLISSVFQQHHLAAWDYITVTAHGNINQFVSGLSCLTSIPSQYFFDNSSNFNRAVTSARVNINASTMTQPELVIPWTYPNAWMRTTGGYESGSDMHTSFTVAMFSILPLRGVEGDSPSIPLRITISIHGLRLACPVNPIPIDQLFSNFPSTTPPSVAVEGHAATTSGTPGQSFMDRVKGDAQNDNASVVYFPRSNAYANYETGIRSLINSEGGYDPGHMTQTTEDPMSIQAIVEKPGLDVTISWSINDQPGTTIYQENVVPLDAADLPFPRTPIAYVSRLYGFFRGRIKYIFTFAKTPFHTGKLAVVAVPIGHTITADNYMNFNHIIIDIKEDSDFEFEVAYCSDKQVLRIYNSRPGGSSASFVGVRLFVMVHTQLQTNASMQPTIDCAIWKCAGRGFSLYNIWNATPVAAVNYIFAIPDPSAVNLRVGPNSQINGKFFLNQTGVVSPSFAPDGQYYLNPPIPEFTFRSGAGTFTWRNIINIYVVNGWLTMTYDFPTSFAGTLDGGSIVPPTNMSIAGREVIQGHTGNISALHDKTEDETPLLGYDDGQDFRPVAEFEHITSILQNLERPHKFIPSNDYIPFVNRTSETIDTFSLFSNCFVFTSGYVQWMIVGANVTIAPLGGAIGVTGSDPSDESFINGGVRIPVEDGHVILFDAPPIHNNVMCMNVAGNLSSLILNPKNVLSGVYLKYKQGTTLADVSLHVRAGPGFSYHGWAGIPTPGEQQRIARQTTEVVDEVPDLTVDARVKFETRLAELRESVLKKRQETIAGHGKDDKSNGKMPKRFERIFSKISRKTKSASEPPPSTERNVQSEHTTVEDCESTESDDDDDHLLLSEASTSSKSFSPISTSSFLPRPVQDTLENLNVRSHRIEESLNDFKKDGKNWLKTSKDEIERTTHAIRKTAGKIEQLADRGMGVINDGNAEVRDRIERLQQNVEQQGMFNTLFGKDSNRSRIVQILLVDAIECVTIRSKIKWAGMLVKLGIAFGLTQKCVDLIVSYFKNRTHFGSPNERQQGVIEGHAGVEDLLPVACSVVSVIVMFASFSYAGGSHVDKKKLPTMWDWVAERARQVNLIDRGMESIFKLFDKINKWVVKLVCKFFPMTETMFDCLNEQRVLKLAREFTEESVKLLEVRTVIKIFGDDNLRKRVIKVDYLYGEIMLLAADPEVSRKHSSLLMRIERMAKELRARIISVLDQQPVRIDPFHISFYGTTEIGKSYLMSTVAYVLGRSQNIPAADTFYPRTPTMEFWDNYRCQEFVGVDDVDQQDTEELAGEMITVKSNVPKVLPMAHLETKGCVFTSRGFLSTTNVPYPEPKSIKCKDAYKRRRNVLVECIMVKDQREFDHSHIVFSYRSPTDPKAPPIGEKMTFAELMADLAVKYSNYLRSQHCLVRAVAPDTKFKPLYIYDRSEESLFKIYQIVNELLARTRNIFDPSIRDINEILTGEDGALIYPNVDKDAAHPEDFQATHVPKAKRAREFEDSDIDEQIGEDDWQEEQDENLLHAGGHHDEHEFDDIMDDINAVIDGHVREGDEEATTSEAISWSDASDFEVVPLENEGTTQREYTPFSYSEYVSGCGDNVVRTFLESVPNDGDEPVRPRVVTVEFLDLLYHLTDKRQGTPKEPSEIPRVDLTPEMRALIDKVGNRYREFRTLVRNKRQKFFKDESDELHNKVIVSLTALNFYLVRYDESDDMKDSAVCASFIVYFAVSALLRMGRLLGHNLKLGYWSRMLRNLNNRILPDTFESGVRSEVYRCVAEAAYTPWCLLQRLIYETRTMIMNGLRYVASVIYEAITERQAPEVSSLVKIGIFMVVGYLMYRGTSWLMNRGKRDPESVAYLEGESDEKENKELRILGREHLGLPDDGHAYDHFHQCERCRLIFKHKHSRSPKTPTYRLFCKACLRKSRTAEQVVPQDNSESDDDVIEGETMEKTIKIKKVTGEAVASSGGTQREKFQKRTKIRGETAIRKKFETTKVEGESSTWKSFFPSVFGKKEEKEVIEGQASDDPQILVILPIVRNNCATFNVGTRGVNALFLCGRWMVTVVHVFEGLHGEVPYCIDWKGKKFPGLLTIKKNLHKGEYITVEGKKFLEDIAFVDLQENRALPSFRDIRSHVASYDDFDLVCGSAGILLEKMHDSGDFVPHPIPKIYTMLDRRVETKFLKEGLTAKTAVSAGWEYHVDIAPGACGSPLICKNRNLTRKLVGFHFGGFRSLGFSFALFRELIDRVITPDTVIGQSKSIDDISRFCKKKYEVFSDDLPIEHTLRVVPSGRIEIIGELEEKWVVAMPRRTDIVPSPYFDQIFEHSTEPSILNDKDPRSPGDIIQRGVDKFGKVHFNKRPRTIMKKIVKHKIKKLELASKDYNGPLRTLTLDEAINGIVGQKYIAPLRMDTSPGFPFVKLRPSGLTGRTFLFEEIGIRKDGGIQYRPGPLLQRYLDEIWDGAAKGEIRHNFYVDTLKDEKRSIARLYKTRFFNVHNVAWQIVHRRLYGAVQAFKLEIGFKVGYALGLDMHGPDASQLVHFLGATGTKWLPEDFAEWDGNVDSNDIGDHFEIEIQFMKLHENDKINEQRRRTRVDAFLDRIQIVDNCVYRAVQGVPSGDGGTSNVNTGTHDLLNDANWIELHLAAGEPEKATCEVKDEQSHEVAVGDDGGGTVSDECCAVYNMVNRATIFKHYGYQCTPPTKDGTEQEQPWVGIEDFQFLKCHFQQDPEYRMIWHMKMAPKVIRELTNWVTISGNAHELFYQNMEDALRFSFHHGKEFYNDYRNKVNKVLREDHAPLLTTRYTDQRADFLEQFDKIVLRDDPSEESGS